MAENKHPHKNVIGNIDEIYPLITIIAESKTSYLKQNLSMHLHASQIKLLKEAKKHEKPQHRKVRVAKYKQLVENSQIDDLFKLHEKLYIKNYEKLAKKGLVKVDTEVEDLPYDIIITEKGKEILKEIDELEAKWQEEVLMETENKEELLKQLKQIAQLASPISYKLKKQQKFVF